MQRTTILLKYNPDLTIREPDQVLRLAVTEIGGPSIRSPPEQVASYWLLPEPGLDAGTIRRHEAALASNAHFFGVRAVWRSLVGSRRTSFAAKFACMSVAEELLVMSHLYPCAVTGCN